MKSLLYSLFLGMLLPALSLADEGTRKRGFDVDKFTPEVIRAAKVEWNANLIRYQLPLDKLARDRHITREEAWKIVVAGIPAGLDEAKKQGICVVLQMHQTGTMDWVPPDDRYGNLAKFWDDEANLAVLTDRWKELAALCAGRDQEIWFDLLNEPLDRRTWPSFPAKWPRWAQSLIDGIRTVDTAHWIVVEPGPGGEMWKGLAAFPLLKDDKLIYSIHQYQPHKYTHQGINSVLNTDLAHPLENLHTPWPGEYTDSWGDGMWDRARLEAMMAPVLDFQKKHPGIRILVGEFSAVRWAPNAADYLRDNIEIFESHGWDWVYHSFREYQGWSLEYDDVSPSDKPVLSPVRTDRGEVVAEYLKRNAP